MRGDGGPGPGHYNPAATKSANVSAGFGTSVRKGGKSDETPGPGHYKLPYKVADVPNYVLPDRPEEFRYR